MELRGDDFVLRRPVEGDVPLVARACDDPESARFLGLPSPYTEAHARAWVASRAETWAEGTKAFVIADSETDELLGAIEVRAHEVGTIGYWIAPWARGRGLATRATALLSRWALTDGGVERLELTTHPANLASQRVAEKAGFRREGVQRGWMKLPDGTRRDSVLFAMLPSDLRA